MICSEGNWMSAGWQLGVKTDCGSYSSTAFWWRQNSATTSIFLIAAEVVVWKFSTHYLVLLQTGTPVWLALLKCHLNISWIAVEDSLFWKKKSLRRTCVGQPNADPCFYSIWCPSESCNALRFMPFPGPPQYYVNQNDEWKLPHSVPFAWTLQISPFSPQMKNIYGFLRLSESTAIVAPTELTNGLS